MSDVVERLQRDLNTYKTIVDSLHKDRDQLELERDTAREEADRLRAQLADSIKSKMNQLDWFQQRFNVLRKWVKDEVEPLSEQVAHRYWNIVANGSPSPFESADWQDTLHYARVQAEVAEKRLAGARAELDALVREQMTSVPR